MRAVLAGALLAALGLSAFVLFACTGDTPAVAAGGDCFLASDCEPGLVCIAQPSGVRQCSNDLSKVTGKPPPEAGPADASREGEAAADGPVDGPADDTSMPDTSMPDTSVADAADSG